MSEKRPLTQAEINRLPDGIVADVAMLSTDGVWYYADSGQALDSEGQVIDATMFVTDEDGDYIPIANLKTG